MTITNEQKELLTKIMENKDNLEELFRIASVKQKQVKDLQMKESINVAGIVWSKFAEDSEGNAYMLADENICNMEFGNDNNWKKSSVRKKLNEELFQKLIDELGADALITIQTDLFSHDGLKDYGVCEDKVALLTYDMYRNNRENIKNMDFCYWLATADSTPSGCDTRYVRCVRSGGDVDCGGCFWGGRGVRPFFILKSSIFVSCEV